MLRKELKNVEDVPHGSTHLEGILDFSSSVIKIPLPLEEIINDLNIFSYPDSDSNNFVSKISEVYDIGKGCIITGNGSSGLLWYTGLAFFSKNIRSLITTPAYGEYERILKIMGCNIYKHKLKEVNDFRLNIDNFISDIKSGNIEVIFLCTPNNPTGEFIDFGKLDFILSKNPDKLFIIDLAYIDYAFSSIIDFKKFIENYNVVFLFSLTKSYGIAGLRSGFIIGSNRLVKSLYKVKEPWNMNVISQKVSSYILENRNSLLAGCKKIMDYSAILRNNIESSGFKVIRSDTDYFMVKVKSPEKIKEILLSENILVRDLNSMGLDNYIRITGKTEELNNYFMEIWYDKVVRIHQSD